LEGGGVDYITKPIESAEVLARIKTHLGMHRLQQRLASQSDELIAEINERKRAEEKLQKYQEHLEDLVEERTSALIEREEKYRSLFESSLDGIAESSLEGKLLSCNPAYSKMTGYSEAEAKKLTYQELTPLKWAEIDKKHVQQCLERGFSDPYEKERLRKDGQVFPISIRIWLRKDKQGNPLSLWGIVRDISDRKRVEKALRESEKKYRSMLEAMKDAAYICSSEFRIEYMNPRMISRIGRDATGQLCHKAVYDSDEKCSWCIFDNIQQREHVEYELEDPKDNRYYSITNSPILHSGGSISKLTIFRDITESKEIEAQLRQASKMESIGTIAGGIAHDFNNLLFMIVGNAELALEDIPEWNSTHTNLKEIKTASLRASGIVKQLLNFSRKTDQKLIPIGAVTVIKDTLKFLRAAIPTTVDIQRHLPDTDMTILADPIQINQLLMNLCTNASQAMKETGGTLEITVENECLTEDSVNNYPNLTAGEHLKLTVSDTGPGIDPEIIDRIFDPYFSTKEVGKGSGMGLSVVHGIVNSHNGAITVDSELGKGATFTVLFPVVSDEPVMEAKPSSDKIPHGNETILFVADDDSITIMIGQMLERLGYRVETRLNPEEALELFQSKPNEFNLIITDMTMPQMTGVKLSEKLKEVRSDVPVIICTGHSSLIDEDKAKKFGIDAYVMKPIVKNDIAKTIRKVLGNAEISGQQ